MLISLKQSYTNDVRRPNSLHIGRIHALDPIDIPGNQDTHRSGFALLLTHFTHNARISKYACACELVDVIRARTTILTRDVLTVFHVYVADTK